ncbi:hypothetical protein C1752_00119 [Acaryochloris thomasi RCC1774]|uniref:FHA domain-containing protein n=1 Tax=Acaryochloris thomasi RCC1774 TaxID=1764569 RepID=A0A2W1K624_9CYAN|nr:FHA domain-containing protein [Acaryochloris thomasi]PZD75231.1 hypothetical protein C1752_00119 [Acaryochloris thomasi RCC1774]
MRIQLIWTDPGSGQVYQPVFALPIALGRSFGLMPGSLDGQAVSRVVLADDQVEIYHALLKEQDGSVAIEGQANASLSVNGIAFSSAPLQEGDLIQIGPFELEFKLPAEDTLPPVAPVEAVPQSPPSAAGEDLQPPSAAGIPNPVSMSGASGFDELASGLSSAAGESVAGNWRCDRKVGFLFKRPCERTTPQGCPYCRNGQANNDPYFYDYDLYPNYGRYGRGYWGYSYYRDRDRYAYNSDSRNVDFTEADAASFEDETDTDYETSFGDS